MADRRSMLRRAFALAFLASALVLVWLLRDYCYGHAWGPNGPLHCYKLNEMRMALALAFVSVASGALTVLQDGWYRRLVWCQVGFGIAGVLEASRPLWPSGGTNADAHGVPLVEGFFALAACLSGFGTWLRRPSATRPLRRAE